MMDVNSLTLGEVAKVEDLAGMSISAISDAEKPKGRALAALAFVFQRRADPTFTWNQAQDLTLEQANTILGITDDDDATAGEDDDLDPFGSTSAPGAS